MAFLHFLPNFWYIWCFLKVWQPLQLAPLWKIIIYMPKIEEKPCSTCLNPIFPLLFHNPKTQFSGTRSICQYSPNIHFFKTNSEHCVWRTLYSSTPWSFATPLNSIRVVTFVFMAWLWSQLLLSATDNFDGFSTMHLLLIYKRRILLGNEVIKMPFCEVKILYYFCTMPKIMCGSIL